MPETTQIDVFFKTILTEYSNDNVKVFMVDGSTIRDPLTDPFDMDFTEGDNDAHNPDLVPPGEAWIDLDVAPTEVRCTILHELTERRHMINDGLEYDEAHDLANIAEQYARSHRDQLNELVMAELKLAPAYKTTEAKAMNTGTKITKTYRAEIKQIDETGHRVYAVFNTSGRDRDNQENAPTAWKKRVQPFLQHNILVSCHTYDDLRKQIGEIELNIQKIDSGLEGWVKYYVGEGNDEADWAFNLAKKNKAAYSVGYMSYDGERGDGEKSPSFLYTDNELLEVSQVIVPSNRQSLSTATRSVSDPVVKSLLDEVEKMDKKETTQQKKEISQSDIKDEIDWLKTMIEEVGLSEETQKAFNELIRRFPADDIAVNIKSSKIRIKHAMDACKSAMDVMTDHDKAHAAAFDSHSKSIIRCYNGLKAMYDHETTPDGTEGEHMIDEVNPTEPAGVTTLSIDDIVASTVKKY